MDILQDFIDTTNDCVKNCKSTIYDFYHKNKKLIPYDEREDFKQDIILVVLKSLETYDSSKGKFSTHLSWKLKTFKQSIISRYTGIKLNYYQYRNYFSKTDGAIKVYSINEQARR